MAALHERLERLLEAAQSAAESGYLARLLEHLEAMEHLLAAPPSPALVEALPAGSLCQTEQSDIRE